MYYNPGTNNLLEINGFLVEADALRVAEALKEYDPDLEILCLKPEMAGAGDAPFQICHKDSTGTLRKIFDCWELDDRVLSRIQLADTHRRNIIKAMETREEEIKKDRDSRYQDFAAERRDLVKSIVKNNKSRYTFRDDTTGLLVTIYDDRPSKRH